MNVTFLIGNGFDRNLGLATTYAEFIKVYKDKNSGSEVLEKLRKHIKDNEELWSAAEKALGEYTGDFDDGKAREFSECHTDICVELAAYLKNQEKRVNYDINININKIKSAMKQINMITKSFPTEERDKLNKIYSKHYAEKIEFSFICFNYTNTLDRCLSITKSDSAVLGSHKYSGQAWAHTISENCHVHGTADKEMVFGVNDDSQIAKSTIFECVNGDIFKNLLIKRNANQSYQENTDGKADKILNSSNIIYIYGMSIGETDRLWWERICKWLENSNEHHLILQCYALPEKEVMPSKYQVAEREYKELIMQYGSYDEMKRKKISDQIHVTADNIFDDMKGIAMSEEECFQKNSTILEKIDT